MICGIMLTKLLTKLFIRISPNEDFMISEKDREKMEEWLADSFDRGVLGHWFKARNYAVLKELGGMHDRERDLLNKGRRLELLHFYGQAKVLSEKRKRNK